MQQLGLLRQQALHKLRVAFDNRVVKSCEAVVIGVSELCHKVEALKRVQQLSDLILAAFFACIYQLLIRELLLVPEAIPRRLIELREPPLRDSLELGRDTVVLVKVGC